MIIDVQNLICGYDSFQINNISFSVEKGCFLGITGPNGSGKTTLLRTISGILKPKSGSIHLHGKNLTEMNPKEIATSLAVVSQNPIISPMTVEEFVLLGRFPHYKRWQFMETPEDLQIAETAMTLTDTLRLRSKEITELSGGERQLALIARALAQKPQVLLLDEPTTFLDITHQVHIMDLLKRLNKQQNLTVISVLHDLNLAAEYCSNIILMKDGNIFKLGSPSDVLTYQTIEEVYNTLVVVGQNPVSNKPYIFLVTEDAAGRSQPPTQGLF